MENKDDNYDDLHSEKESLVLVSLKCRACSFNNQILIKTIEGSIAKCQKCDKTLFKATSINGYIYVLSNPIFKNLVKIGMTNRSVELRIKELNSSTALPENFRLELLFPTKHPQKDERKIHSALQEFRHSERREFFNISLYSAYEVIKKIVQFEAVALPLGVKSIDELENHSAMQNRVVTQSETQAKQHNNFSARKRNGKFICTTCGSKLRLISRGSTAPSKAILTCKKCDAYFSEDGTCLK